MAFDVAYTNRHGEQVPAETENIDVTSLALRAWCNVSSRAFVTVLYCPERRAVAAPLVTPMSVKTMRRHVFAGKTGKTPGRLSKDDLVQNNRGKVVKKKASELDKHTPGQEAHDPLQQGQAAAPRFSLQQSLPDLQSEQARFSLQQ